MVFEKFESPNELVEYRLDCALRMDRDVLKMLGMLEAIGEPAAVAVLQQNLAQERHALDEAMRSMSPAI